jgi:GNAT superfamily N-acetyltransferase
VWRDTYRHIAPPEALRRLDEAHRLPSWQRTLAGAEEATGAIVAQGDAGLLGVISFGPPGPSMPASALEIRHLYVLPAARGTGLGAALLRAGLDRGRSLGLSEVVLSVVRENRDARRFYAAMGGTETGGFTDPGPLWRSENIVVSWRGSPAATTPET